MHNLNGKICLVTGALGGLGSAIVRRLMADGGFVVASDIAAENAFENISATFGASCSVHLDVRNRNQIFKLVSDIERYLGSLDIVVNAAGIVRSGEFDDLSEEAWDQMLGINLKGTFFVCQASLRAMRKQREGVIVNIASDAGQIGSTLSSVDYAVSKSGVINLTRCLAKTAAKDGIRANSIAPGAIETGMMDVFRDHWGAGGFQNFVEAIPMRRLGTPEDVANVVSFLVSDEASYITGACFDVNGGLVMR